MRGIQKFSFPSGALSDSTAQDLSKLQYGIILNKTHLCFLWLSISLHFFLDVVVANVRAFSPIPIMQN